MERIPRVYETTVKEFIKDESGKMCRAVLISLASQKDPETGRTSMVPVEGSEREVAADLVLIAAGFLGAQRLCGRSLWCGLKCPHQCGNGNGKLCYNGREYFYCR